MECGFYHPSVGYWQTNNKPAADTVAAYPEGTVEVPIKTQANTEWDGKTWVILPLALNQLAADARAKRNTLLAASDWTQVADAPVNKTAWAAYRQELRDITNQVGFPTTIDWPVEP